MLLQLLPLLPLCQFSFFTDIGAATVAVGAATVEATAVTASAAFAAVAFAAVAFAAFAVVAALSVLNLTWLFFTRSAAVNLLIDHGALLDFAVCSNVPKKYSPTAGPSFAHHENRKRHCSALSLVLAIEEKEVSNFV